MQALSEIVPYEREPVCSDVVLWKTFSNSSQLVSSKCLYHFHGCLKLFWVLLFKKKRTEMGSKKNLYWDKSWRDLDGTDRILLVPSLCSFPVDGGWAGGGMRRSIHSPEETPGPEPQACISLSPCRTQKEIFKFQRGVYIEQELHFMQFLKTCS